MKHLISQAQAINEQLQAFKAIEREYADLIYYNSLSQQQMLQIELFNNQNTYNNETYI